MTNHEKLKTYNPQILLDLSYFFSMPPYSEGLVEKLNSLTPLQILETWFKAEGIKVDVGTVHSLVKSLCCPEREVTVNPKFYNLPHTK